MATRAPPAVAYVHSLALSAPRLDPVIAVALGLLKSIRWSPAV